MKILEVAKRILRKIPGFRRLSSQSMVIAATWYGAAFFILLKYWHWGLAMLALPFLVFYLIDGDKMRNRKMRNIVAIAAGALVLLGTAAGGLSAGAPGVPAVQTALNTPALPQTPAATAALPPEDTPTAAVSAAPSVAPTPSPGIAAGTPESPAPSATADEPAPAYDPEAHKFVASKSSDTFHLPGCSSAKAIKPENRIGFATRDEAADSGRRACKRCKP